MNAPRSQLRAKNKLKAGIKSGINGNMLSASCSCPKFNKGCANSQVDLVRSISRDKAQPMRSSWSHMSKANLADRGVRHASVVFHFPYLTHSEQDELRRFKKIHIDELR